MSDAIKVTNLVKSFGEGELETRVLKDLNLTIKKGEFVALMGKSGAGKSTLLYQMSLLDHPTSGTVELLEHVVNDLNEDERTAFRLAHLGYIFQDYALVPELSAEENVMLPLIMLGWENPKAIKVAQETLEEVGLDARYHYLPNQLSGGQQQRVSIARAVAKNPEILFADEPTANLDNASSDDVVKVLHELHDAGQTILMVTHEHEYTKYCTRVVWMEDGKITKELEPYREEEK